PPACSRGRRSSSRLAYGRRLRESSSCLKLSEASPECHHRKYEAVKVIVDVEVAREPGAGVLRFIPGAVRALGVAQPADTAGHCLRASLAGGMQPDQRPGRLRRGALA